MDGPHRVRAVCAESSSDGLAASLAVAYDRNALVLHNGVFYCAWQRYYRNLNVTKFTLNLMI